jgi:hypothetical protein
MTIPSENDAAQLGRVPMLPLDASRGKSERDVITTHDCSGIFKERRPRIFPSSVERRKPGDNLTDVFQKIQSNCGIALIHKLDFLACVSHSRLS